MHTGATILSLLLAITTASDVHWGYKGKEGPIHWHRMLKGFHQCDGKSQSPIDIISRRTVHDPTLTDFALWYDLPQKGSKFRVANNGHSVVVNTIGEFYVANGGLPSTYTTKQFHFHWGHANSHGSEHKIDGQQSPLELHVVSFDSKNYLDIAEAMVKPQGLAVLGVMFELTDADNPALTNIIRSLEKIKDPDDNVEVEIPAQRIRDFLPEDTTKYFRYNGSLTTPNCFESVVWTLFQEKQKISYDQLFKFRRVLQKARRKHKHQREDYHTHDGKEGRRKREVNNLRRRIRNAKEFLEEAGIKGDIGEEMEFKLQLEMMKENEQNQEELARIGELENFQLNDDESPDSVLEPGVIPEPENTAEPEPHENHHHGNHGNSDEEIIEFQDILIDNFRPVQRLNGRIVYRSFSFERSPSKPTKRRGSVRHAPVNSRDYNSAGISVSSIFFTFSSVLMSYAFMNKL